jgi:predicted LPLAT superfamily acyltransferase
VKKVDFKPCILIPHFNHSDLISGVLNKLRSYDIPCLVVDDGSAPEHRQKIRDLCQSYDEVVLRENGLNVGKGGAVTAGMIYAFEQGFTHAIQLDADGQHDLSSLIRLIEVAKKNPNDFVTGIPIYGEDIPKGRKLGRWITHFWVWVETLSFEIKDTMCGFRVYPLKACVPILSKNKLGSRMEFDTQIVVNLFWAGTKVHQIPVKVAYPTDGRSHFRYFRDNVLISWAHTGMVLGMLRRLPRWFLKGFHPEADIHWARRKEAGTLLGMRLLLGIYALLGRRVLTFALLFVVSYYYLMSGSARRASKGFLAAYTSWVDQLNRKPEAVSSFWHIYQFAESLLDKVAVWRGDINVSQIAWEDHAVFDQLVERRQGAVFFTSHFGNIETTRCLVRQFSRMRVNVLVYTEHAKKFNGLLEKLDLDVQLNIISVPTIGVQTGILLKQKVDAGEWIFVMADRTSIASPGRTLNGTFMGRSVELPYGPFALADVLDVPIFTMHCYKQKGGFQVGSTKLTEPGGPNELNRDKRCLKLADSYLRELERLVLKAPMQWFNFFDFWKKHG